MSNSTEMTQIEAKKTRSCGCMHIWTMILLVIVTVSSLTQGAYLYYVTSGKTVKESLLEHEYAKVGGKSNYNVITALQQEILSNPASGQDVATQQQFLEQLRNANGRQGTATATSNETTDSNIKLSTLTADQQAAILKNAVIEGNKDADIVVVEYSEMECPFCSQQYHDTKLKENLEKTYGDKVAFIYKSNRGANHSGTEAKQVALLCVKDVAGDEAYTKFYEYIMDRTTLRPNQRDGGVYPVTDLAEAAKAAGVTDITKWQSCVDNKQTLDQFNAETKEARSFNLGGTPGTLIFSRKAGKYTTVSGAYPFQTFEQAIAALQKAE